MKLGKYVWVAYCLLGISSRLSAQTVERPVAFDSAGRIMVVTPEIARSIGVKSWPVDRNFSEARLYSVSDNSYVLVVTRTNGTIERYPISEEARREFAASLTGVSASTEKHIKSESKNSFIRNQTLIGLLIYGPTAASVIEGDGSTSTATYLLVSGATFFAASQYARTHSINPSQNELATHAATRGALAGAATAFLAGGHSKAKAFGALAGGVTGTALGLHFGKNMSEGEAAASGFGADFGALTAGGVAAIFGETCRDEQLVTVFGPTYTSRVCRERISEKGVTAMALAAGLIGYPLGYKYAQKASYNVTAGDIGSLWTTAAIGTLAGAALVARDNASVTSVGLGLTTGFVGGVIVGDRLLVRKKDHTRGDAALAGLGASAGGLMGAGVGVLIDESDSPQLIFGLAALGGAVGLIAGEHFAETAPDAGKRVSFTPQNLLFAAAKVPGNHSLFQVKF